MKVQLNAASIAKLTPGKYADEKQPGLFLNVTLKDKRWQFYAWLHGKPTKKALGVYGPNNGADAARAAVRQLLGSEKPEVKVRSLTLGELVDVYSKRCVKLGNRTAHMDQSFALNWADWGKRPIDSITIEQVEARHDKISSTRGPAAARRAVKALRILYNFAQSRDRNVTYNPASGVIIAKTVKRDVYLTEDEVVVFKSCLAEMAPGPRDFFTLCLSTGLRRSNITGMQKSWVNLEDATVTVPAEFSKNGKPIELPLMPDALAILRARMPGDSLFIFPANTASGHLGDPSSWMVELRMLMRKQGVTKHFTIHDLRRTMATRLNNAGVNIATIARALGHSSLSATMIYAHNDTESIRAALGAVAGA